MLKFFRIPFGNTGDRAAIPDAIDASGFVSYTQGYGFDYQRQKTDPAAKNIERDKANQLYFNITTAIAELQATGAPDFITTALNGGTPYPYDVNAVCRYNGLVYASRKTNNTSLPTVAADWAVIRESSPRVVATGTVDAIVANFVPTLSAAQDGECVFVRHTGANVSATPTLNANGLGAFPIVKGNNSSLATSDIPGAGYWGQYLWDASLSKWVMQNPATGLASGIPTGTSIAVNGNTAPAGFLKENGAAYSRTVYAQLFANLVKSAVATISIATPGVITWNNHGLSANDPVKFSSTGVLPTGLTGGTTYYVVGASITTNTFQLSATPGGAAIATSGSQSGIHTAINAPYGDGDGSTTFNVPDSRGEFWRGWDDGRGVDANRARGSAQADAMQGHFHNVPNLSGTSSPNNGIGGGNNTPAGAFSTGAAITDGTNGTPRTAAETRSRNVPKLFCIKF